MEKGERIWFSFFKKKKEVFKWVLKDQQESNKRLACRENRFIFDLFLCK